MNAGDVGEGERPLPQHLILQNPIRTCPPLLQPAQIGQLLQPILFEPARDDFDVGGVLRLNLVSDAAWATDEASGLRNELLAGVGIAGTVIGPWKTVINLDIGKAVDGPDDGFSVFLAVLKLFD